MVHFFFHLSREPWKSRCPPINGPATLRIAFELNIQREEEIEDLLRHILKLNPTHLVQYSAYDVNSSTHHSVLRQGFEEIFFSQDRFPPPPEQMPADADPPAGYSDSNDHLTELLPDYTPTSSTATPSSLPGLETESSFSDVSSADWSDQPQDVPLDHHVFPENPPELPFYTLTDNSPSPTDPFAVNLPDFEEMFPDLAHSPLDPVPILFDADAAALPPNFDNWFPWPVLNLPNLPVSDSEL